MDREPRTLPASDVTPASTLIAPDDDMCCGDADHYFRVGREALAFVRDARMMTGGDHVGAILDLPCGYGRVARWLRGGFPGARLTVSDTNASGVAFCVEHFGATGVVAQLDGAHWALLPDAYDVIWCGSLLTHLDRDRWVDHRRRWVTARGVVVFTTHGTQSWRWLQSGDAESARACAPRLRRTGSATPTIRACLITARPSRCRNGYMR